MTFVFTLAAATLTPATRALVALVAFVVLATGIIWIERTAMPIHASAPARRGIVMFVPTGRLGHQAEPVDSSDGDGVVHEPVHSSDGTVHEPATHGFSSTDNFIAECTMRQK